MAVTNAETLNVSRNWAKEKQTRRTYFLVLDGSGSLLSSGGSGGPAQLIHVAGSPAFAGEALGVSREYLWLLVADTIAACGGSRPSDDEGGEEFTDQSQKLTDHQDSS
jgi:hypothetical protein